MLYETHILWAEVNFSLVRPIYVNLLCLARFRYGRLAIDSYRKSIYSIVPRKIVVKRNYWPLLANWNRVPGSNVREALLIWYNALICARLIDGLKGIIAAFSLR